MRVGDTRQWALIRYISGILKKKVEALDEVITGQSAFSRLRSVEEEAASVGRRTVAASALPHAEVPNPELLLMPGVTLSVPRPALTFCLTRST